MRWGPQRSKERKRGEKKGGLQGKDSVKNSVKLSKNSVNSLQTARHQWHLALHFYSPHTKVRGVSDDRVYQVNASNGCYMYMLKKSAIAALFNENASASGHEVLATTYRGFAPRSRSGTCPMTSEKSTSSPNLGFANKDKDRRHSNSKGWKPNGF